jgi:hypothetical protein
MIDQAMNEIRQLGTLAHYDDLRTIRQAYDGPAKAVYSPAVTQDFMSRMGEKLGAADVTGALRDHLARLDPQTAKANANYSLWKTASDVLQAAEEVDRVRPTVGRTLLARGLGATVGGAVEGTLGAAMGAMLGPLVERGIAGLAPAAKMTMARTLAKLADAVRTGQGVRIPGLVKNLHALLPAAAVAKSAQTTGVSAPALVPALVDQAPSPGTPGQTP